jgi:hypothetical protein
MVGQVVVEHMEGHVALGKYTHGKLKLHQVVPSRKAYLQG